MKRHRNLLVLALCGFVTSFGAHVVATNLPWYAASVGAGAFMIGFVSCGTFALLCLFPLVKKRTLRNAKALLL